MVTLTHPMEVSIPSWIFWSSQLVVVHNAEAEQAEFQFRLGFSGRRNLWSSTTQKQSRLSFNSVLDFLVVATRLFVAIDDLDGVFQFRLGFSGRRNLTQSSSLGF